MGFVVDVVVVVIVVAIFTEKRSKPLQYSVHRLLPNSFNNPTPVSSPESLHCHSSG